MIINTVIVDDNLSDVQLLESSFLSSSDPTYKVTCYTNPLDESIFNQSADLYVFDIDMPHITGFDLAKKIIELKQSSTIIFCSQHNDLVFESFRFSCDFFIRKSDFHHDFYSAITKLNNQFLSKQNEYIYSVNKQTRRIPYQQIVYVEVNHNICSIHLENGEILKQRSSISSFQKQLKSNYFIRIHTSYILNISYLESIQSNKAILKNGVILFISRSYLQSVCNLYRTFRIER